MERSAATTHFAIVGIEDRRLFAGSAIGATQLDIGANMCYEARQAGAGKPWHTWFTRGL
ncbi:MAG: hypothetical protein MUD01_22425 [Chloroflexaceae bacterium]|nr:hypothetical protein [Chloroflexaceae bacterium]